MNVIYKISVIFLLISYNISAQTFNATIFSSDSLTKVSRATIFNRATQKYTISDVYGSFKIDAHLKDTLEIRKLGFEDIKQKVEILGDSILLKKEIIEMPSVFISNEEPKQINKKLKTKIQIGLSYLKTYAFKLDVSNGDIITSIELPIKNRSKHSEVGSIDFQVYSHNKDKNTFDNPKTEVITVDHIDKLNNKIKLDFMDFEVKADEIIYILISRKIPSSEIPTTSKSTSLNPFFKCDKTENKDNLKFRFNGENKWYDASIYYTGDNVPYISASIYGYESSN